MLFDDAQEATLLLLAKGYKEKNDYVGYGIVDNLTFVKKTIDDMSKNKNKYQIQDVHNWNFNMLSPDMKVILETLLKNKKIFRLGDIASVKIGVVTGANSYFILSETQIKNLNLPVDFFNPIINRATILRGIDFTNDDFNNLQSHKKKYILLLNKVPDNELIKKYLEKGIIENIHKRYKTKNRKIWFNVDYGTKPDAFFHYMSGECPHIVRNISEYTSTNAIHKIMWNQEFSSHMQNSIAFSSLTSLTQLSVELYGRSYGGGILKLEPSEAKKIILPVSNYSKNIEEQVKHVNQYLKKGDKESARGLADELFLKEFLNLEEDLIVKIQESYKTLKNTRIDRSRARAPARC